MAASIGSYPYSTSSLPTDSIQTIVLCVAVGDSCHDRGWGRAEWRLLQQWLGWHCRIQVRQSPVQFLHRETPLFSFEVHTTKHCSRLCGSYANDLLSTAARYLMALSCSPQVARCAAVSCLPVCCRRDPAQHADRSHDRHLLQRAE